MVMDVEIWCQKGSRLKVPTYWCVYERTRLSYERCCAGCIMTAFDTHIIWCLCTSSNPDFYLQKKWENSSVHGVLFRFG